MAPATGDEAIYTDCSNVALYSGKKGKVGVYCWLGGPGCLPCGSPSKVEVDPAKISDEVHLKNDSAPKSTSKGFQANGSIGSPLPATFVSVLAELKAKTSIPVLLPLELPTPFGDAKYATVEKATRDEYGVALYYELDVGDAGFAAFFAASSSSPYSPRELGNVRKMKLPRGIVGFFRPVSCGGSCAPANLWWEQGGTLYQIQLKLPSTLGEKKQQRIITAVANSAIQAGPR